MRLSHSDVEALQQAILELHAPPVRDPFRRAVPGIFLRLVPGDYFLLTDYHLDPTGKGVRLRDYLESDKRLTRETVASAERQMGEVPFPKDGMAGGSPKALRQVDFLAWAQFTRSSWGEGLRRDAHIDRMISLPVTRHGETTTVVNLCRHGKDYGGRDRRLLNLVRPHYDQACRNIRFMAARLAEHAKTPAAHALTPREAEVANWLAQGKTNPEIAMILGASARTVEKHMERVLEKLGAENRTVAAVMIASANGQEHHVPARGNPTRSPAFSGAGSKTFPCPSRQAGADELSGQSATEDWLGK